MSDDVLVRCTRPLTRRARPDSARSGLVSSRLSSYRGSFCFSLARAWKQVVALHGTCHRMPILTRAGRGVYSKALAEQTAWTGAPRAMHALCARSTTCVRGSSRCRSSTDTRCNESRAAAPLPRDGFFSDSAYAAAVGLFVSLVKVRRLRVGGACAVRVGQQRADRDHDRTHGVDWTPIVLNQVEAERSIRINVGVELQARTRGCMAVSSSPTKVGQNNAVCTAAASPSQT